MRLMERLYRSPAGRIMSVLARGFFAINRPRMIYGYPDSASGQFRKYTRVSSTAVIMSPERLSIGDQVWIWHHSIIDATEGIEIGEGAQIGAWVGIFTHASSSSIRLLGNRFVHIPNWERRGYIRGGVKIGAYSFIGAGSLVMPGVSLGKGSLVSASSVVTRDVPDFAIVRGTPAKVVGDTISLDSRDFDEFDFSDTYYDEEALQRIRELRAKQLAEGANEG
jgi:acetyltransferase-like isoleucine patch superfamily enzyme